MAQSHEKIVRIVRGRDLDRAGAEFTVDEVVGDDGDFAAGNRQREQHAANVQVALILRVHGHRRVAEHGFRPRGGHGHVA